MRDEYLARRQPGYVTRRSFALLASVATMSLVGTAPATATTSALTQDEVSLILRLANVIATTPVPFPSFGEPGDPRARVTATRVGRGTALLPAERLQNAKHGIANLTALTPGLTAEDVVTLIGTHLKAATAATRSALCTTVALAIATVSNHFDPRSDTAAELWLGFTERYAARSAG